MSPRALTLLTAAGLVAASCKPTTIVAGAPHDDNSGTKAAVPLPPSVKESNIYRCADNSVIYIDYLADDRTANLRTGEQAPNVVLTGGTASYSGSGYTVLRQGGAISLSRPGHASLRCAP